MFRVAPPLPPPQFVLNDKISYPEETFMDWEFKILVMYDIAMVSPTLTESRSLPSRLRVMPSQLQVDVVAFQKKKWVL